MRALPLLLMMLSACATAPSDRASREEIASHEPPLACTLTPDELQSRRELLLPGLMERAEQVTDLDDGVRLQFESSPGLLAELAQLIDSERSCCSFLRFQVTAEPGIGPVTLDVTGPPGTRELLREL